MVAGASLLTLGGFVNADRFDRRVDEAAELANAPEIAAPDIEIPDIAIPETSHKGEQGQLGKGPPPFRPPSAKGGYGRGGGGGYDVGSKGGGTDRDYSRAQKYAEQYAERSAERSAETYAELPPNGFVATTEDRKSTFSIDVDTAAYADVRRFLLTEERLPWSAAVRTEELINYFNYDYPQPSGNAPFSLTTEVGPCPWNPEHRLVHIGVQGKQIEPGEIPPRNLVFLLDVSGSMQAANRLPLVKRALTNLVEQLDERDRVSIVVYAGAAGLVLPPTSGADKPTILAALGQLQGGGSTNGGAGIQLAYDLAQQNFVEGGVNRVVLATDGDFNVGVTDHSALIELIEKKRETGVFLSVLGFGRGNTKHHTMEQLANKGNGNYSYIDSMFEARKVLVAEAGATLVTIAKDVKIQVEFDPRQVARHRLVGYENRVMAHHEFDDDRKDAGEIGAGHSVTAIYEIAPATTADADDPLLQLHLRYKQPDGDKSRKLSVAVDDDGQSLEASSNDFRFAAAVAAFAERLRGEQGLSYAQILALARASMGADAYCYRSQFLQLVWQAGRLSGEQLDEPVSSCSPSSESPPKQVAVAVEHEVEVEREVEVEVAVEVAVAVDERAPWQAFVLEVLRLLPPFLALPMFVLAMRNPRRKR